jgi:ATP-binding cassette subfamily B protein
VQQALATVMKGRTTIVIAHRLSTVVDADTIVVLDEGQVIEQGSHQALLEKTDGVYARFYRVRNDKGLQLVDDTGLQAERPSKKKVAGGAA